jgi:hypothetical protein
MLSFKSFIAVTPGGMVLWTNIGVEKSPPLNMDAMCAKCERIAPMLSMSVAELAVTSIAPPTGLKRK